MADSRLGSTSNIMKRVKTMFKFGVYGAMSAEIPVLALTLIEPERSYEETRDDYERKHAGENNCTFIHKNLNCSDPLIQQNLTQTAESHGKEARNEWNEMAPWVVLGTLFFGFGMGMLYGYNVDLPEDKPVAAPEKQGALTAAASSAKNDGGDDVEKLLKTPETVVVTQDEEDLEDVYHALPGEGGSKDITLGKNNNRNNSSLGKGSSINDISLDDLGNGFTPRRKM